MSIVAFGREADRRSVRSPLTWRLIHDETGRDAVRSQVADFLRTHARPRYDHVVFGLPGPTWAFERMLQASWGANTRFIGLERAWPVVEAGLPHMPGQGRRRVSFDLHDATIHGYQSTGAIVWCSSAEVFFRGPGTRCGNTKAGDWRKQSGKWTAGWLDFNGPLGPDMLIVLPRVQCKTNMFVPEVPIALTFMRGRETAETTAAIELAGGRVKYAASLLNSSNHGSFHLSHCIDHGDGDTMPMTTMFGVIQNGKYAPRLSN